MYPARQGLNNKPVPGSLFAGFDVARYDGRLTLGKEERLSRALLLDKLFKEGKSVSQNGFTLIYLRTELPSLYPAQAAFSAPKKHFKNATDRNRIKRLLRESYRKNKSDLYKKLTEQKQQLAMMLIYKGAKVPEYEATETNVCALLAKLIAKL